MSREYIYAKFNQILLDSTAVLSLQMLAALGIDTASLHSYNASPLASKNANDRRHRMKPRVSENSTDDNKSPQSEPYNQRRMVRGSSCAPKITHPGSFHEQ